MIQLVRPNYNVIGVIGDCLKYVNDSINTPQSQRLPCATDAWNKTKFRHLDMNFPPDVIVPVWFSYFANIGGVYKDWGHVCWHDPKLGFVSSPWQRGTTKAIIGSLSELIRIYSDNGANPMKLLGWSEDISNVRVVQEDDVHYPTPAEVKQYFAEAGHPCSQHNIDTYGKKDISWLYHDLLADVVADKASLQAQLTAANTKLTALQQTSQTGVIPPTTEAQITQTSADTKSIKEALVAIAKWFHVPGF